MLCYLRDFFDEFPQYFVLVHLYFHIPLLQEFQPRKQHTIIDRNRSLISLLWFVLDVWLVVVVKSLPLLMLHSEQQNRSIHWIVMRKTYLYSQRSWSKHNRHSYSLSDMIVIGIFSKCGLDKEERREKRISLLLLANKSTNIIPLEVGRMFIYFELFFSCSFHTQYTLNSRHDYSIIFSF